MQMFGWKSPHFKMVLNIWNTFLNPHHLWRFTFLAIKCASESNVYILRGFKHTLITKHKSFCLNQDSKLVKSFSSQSGIWLWYQIWYHTWDLIWYQYWHFLAAWPETNNLLSDSQFSDLGPRGHHSI